MFMAAGERAGARWIQRSSPAALLSRAQSQSPPSSAAPSSTASDRSGKEDGGGEGTADESVSLPQKRKEHVDKSLLRFLVGKGGSTKAKLEKDNGVKLYIPSIGEAESGSSVEINGNSESAVKAACAAIQETLAEAIQSKLQYTHFISLPLACHPALVEKLTEFQDFILSSRLQNAPLQDSASAASVKDDVEVESSGVVEAESSGIVEVDTSGIDKSIFTKPATFHLTILMLKLWNDERVQAASSTLQRIIPAFHDALEGQPLTLNLQGTECLRGKPEKAHVLYARIEESKSKNRLLQACQVLTDAFVESGLVLEKDIGQPLKLHATLMNTTNRKSKGNQRSWKRKPFDARTILEKYGDWNWGEYVVSEVHLSQRFVYDENGYYRCISTIQFPHLVA